MRMVIVVELPHVVQSDSASSVAEELLDAVHAADVLPPVLHGIALSGETLLDDWEEVAVMDYYGNLHPVEDGRDGADTDTADQDQPGGDAPAPGGRFVKNPAFGLIRGQ